MGERKAWGGFMLVKRSGKITGLLLHNDRSSHAGTRTCLHFFVALCWWRDTTHMSLPLLGGELWEHGFQVHYPFHWQAWVCDACRRACTAHNDQFIQTCAHKDLWSLRNWKITPNNGDYWTSWGYFCKWDRRQQGCSIILKKTKNCSEVTTWIYTITFVYFF